MEISEIFQEILCMYPKEIPLSGTILHANGGATIPGLVQAHDRVEEAIFEKGPEFRAMDWAIFQTLHAAAKSAFSDGHPILVTRSISAEKSLTEYQVNIRTAT